MKRLFVAAKTGLSEDFCALSKRLQQNMRFDKIIWVNPDLQHITLRFLGKTPDFQISPLCEVLSETAKQTLSFNLQMNKLGVFGSRYAPTTLWFGFNEFSLFKTLFHTLEEKLVNIGFESQQGNFVPHLTIGRIKEIDHKKNFWKRIEDSQPSFNQSVLIDELHLIQSKLSSDGPSYSVLKSFPF